MNVCVERMVVWMNECMYVWMCASMLAFVFSSVGNEQDFDYTWANEFLRAHLLLVFCLPLCIQNIDFIYV